MTAEEEPTDGAARRREARRKAWRFGRIVSGVLVALFAAAADARMIHAGELHSPQRLPRHVWRMCFALFITAGSFFLGELLGVRSAHGQFAVPPPLRIPVLLALPVVAVLLVMLYWLRRVRVRNIQRAAPALRSQPAGD